jgi:HlyD family secretion protein
VPAFEVFRPVDPVAEPASTLSATGYLQAVRKATIGFKLSGRLLERNVDEGDRVEAGQLLARLDSSEQRAAVLRQEGFLEATRAALAELTSGFRQEEIAKASSALEEARANRLRAEQELQRVRSLQSRKAASRSQLDDAEALANAARAAAEAARQQYSLMKRGPRVEHLDAARAQVKQAEAMLSLAKTQLAETELRAPFAGVILQRNADVGSMLMFGGIPGTASSAAEVFTLADLSEMEAEVDIAESSVSQVRQGQPAEFSADAVPDRKYRGVVSKVLPRANRQKAIVPVRVRVLDPDARLRPELSVKVTFLERARETASGPTPLRIPRSAVVQRAGLPAVFVLDGGRLHLRTVALGPASGAQAELTTGISPGEAIVVHPGPDTADGQLAAESKR